MRTVGATLILLGLGGFLLPLFGVQFRLVLAVRELLGEAGRYAPLLLVGLGVVVLFSAEIFGQRGRRLSTAEIQEIQSDLLVQAIPSQEDISNAGVSKLTQEVTLALYPYVEQIIILRAAGELYMRMAAQFSKKAGVSELDVQYFLWALDMIDNERRKAAGLS